MFQVALSPLSDLLINRGWERKRWFDMASPAVAQPAGVFEAQLTN
jgi:hypothetical protein